MRGVDEKIRRANAALAAVLAVFFFGHAFLGSASQVFFTADAPGALIWSFIALMAVHVVLCGVASWYMLTDTKRPPSVKKRRHLWLKWATGTLLLVAALVHALRDDMSADVLLLVVLAVLAWHALVGCKSLARDLGMPRGSKQVLRAGVIFASAAIAVLVVLALV